MGFLAERAGVSKPVVYEHFGSRPGLLIALYKQIDERQVAVALEALDRAPRTLEDAARVLSRAYMNCYNTVAPEWHAISAALKGAEEMEAFQNELIDEYALIYVRAFSPYVNLSKRALRIRCVGILGAAESISREMLRGRISESVASDTLGSMIMPGRHGCGVDPPLAPRQGKGLAGALDLGPRRTISDVIIDQPHRLHEGIHRGRPDEFPSQLLEVLGQRY